MSTGVYKAINRVQAQLAKEGISKDRSGTGINYKFRGIDDIYNSLSGLLAEAGLTIVPRVLDREVTERETKSKTAMFYVTVKAEYIITAAEDGSQIVACVYGEAMDTSDKATNKAMSAAYKYLCLQTFCIPTEGDNDADATKHEVIAQPPKLTKEQRAEVKAEYQITLSYEDGVPLLEDYLVEFEQKLLGTKTLFESRSLWKSNEVQLGIIKELDRQSYDVLYDMASRHSKQWQ